MLEFKSVLYFHKLKLLFQFALIIFQNIFPCRAFSLSFHYIFLDKFTHQFSCSWQTLLNFYCNILHSACTIFLEKVSNESLSCNRFFRLFFPLVFSACFFRLFFPLVFFACFCVNGKKMIVLFGANCSSMAGSCHPEHSMQKKYQEFRCLHAPQC